MKILVIDDDEMMLKTLEYGLLQEGYNVLTSPDGYGALKIIETEKPNLIISDIAMPSLSGLELLSYLKNKGDNKIPVILISGLYQQSVILTALKLGAYDYLIKPINFEDLSLRIKKALSVPKPVAQV